MRQLVDALALFQQTGNLTQRLSSFSCPSCDPTAPPPGARGSEERKRQGLAACGQGQNSGDPAASVLQSGPGPGLPSSLI